MNEELLDLHRQVKELRAELDQIRHGATSMTGTVHSKRRTVTEGGMIEEAVFTDTSGRRFWATREVTWIDEIERFVDWQLTPLLD